MKTRYSFSLALLLALLAPVFQSMAAGRETREVASFTQVSLGNSVTVVVVQGSPQKVEVEGTAEDLAHLETTVRDQRLRINTVRETNRMSSYRFKSNITVYVTAPVITGLSVSGSGTLKAAAGVNSTELSLSLSGSGRVEVGTVQATTLHSSIAGSGSIVIGKGTITQHEVSISGSGSLKAADVRAETGRVSISGSGDCFLNATRTLEASIIGSGDVHVTGNPKVNSSVVGSGRVHRS
ncbi:head GIN domain-containing protein [Hymenobacter fastidiosus]|uniref:Head GIN domain-containing protein n=1 Tax=Hymenobacter fastidiosus TaxID=486264 RepID=A0ABP7RVD8_9BACT